MNFRLLSLDKLAHFSANHKCGISENTIHDSTQHYGNGDSSADQLGGFDSDRSIWYTSGYTALANFFRETKIKIDCSTTD